MANRSGSYNPAQDLVDTPAYRGPCRRRSTEEERDLWEREHPSDERPWHAFLPRPVLVALLAVAAGAVLWLGQRWVSGVDAHIENAPAGFQRLANVERQVQEMADEMREMRRDQLETQIWSARRAKDLEAARYFEGRLRRLRAEGAAKD